MEDKKRILKMIEDGIITAEEGMKLLTALDGDGKHESNEKYENEDEFFKLPKNNELGKMFYIRVKSHDGSKVRVNIPIDFIKIMGSSAIGCEAQLNKYDVDMEKIIKAIDSGFIGRIVEVETEEGDKVIVEIA